MLGKIAARRVQTHVLARQVALDQVRVVGLDVADGQVRLATRQVADLARRGQQHPNIRVLGMHAAHRLHDEVAGHGFRSCHAHDPGQAVVQALHLPLQLVGRLLHALGGGKRQFARRSRHIAPRRACQPWPDRSAAMPLRRAMCLSDRWPGKSWRCPNP
ncbi:hypothetical protein G6F23_014418 [Rhizopus arrhizus]|nr:hypothetical protein G6F23_014418 [Rhizopus arrhizus]